MSARATICRRARPSCGRCWLAVTVTDAAGRRSSAAGQTNDYGDPVEGSAIYGVTWQDTAGHPTDRLWEAEKPSRDHRIPAGGTVMETYRFPLPRERSARFASARRSTIGPRRAISAP